MIPRIPIIVFGVLLMLASCSEDSESPQLELPAELLHAVQRIDMSLDTLETSNIAGVVACEALYPDTAMMRATLRTLVNRSTLDIEYSFVDAAGVMRIIEPAKYWQYQGSDISAQDHIRKLFQYRQPVLSASFFAVEGFYAAVMVHPVTRGATMLGGVDAMFLPEELIGRLIEPMVKNQDFDIWVMEKGGRVLYDQDRPEIGRNVFTDSLYQGFPELLRAAHEIDSLPAGTTEYSFYDAGTQVVVRKLTYWSTITTFGTDWKVVWVKAEIGG